MPVATRSTYGPLMYATPQVGAVQDSGVGIGFDANLNYHRDGTPQRVAAVLIASGALLLAFKLAGFRFNVGVTS